MKNIPIVILNKDRLEPIKMLVKSLKQRSYNNIVVIDNRSTYQPLLNWYKEENIDVFYNDIPETLFDTGTFYRLAFEIRHPKFVNLVNTHYVYTDSDVVPIDDAPEDFIEHMINVRNKYNVHKVGLSLKIDDLPDCNYSKIITKLEGDFWINRLQDSEYELYSAGIDTAFAVYAPHSKPLISFDSIRMGYPHMAKHMPWYYDVDNLPEDEYYYVKNLDPRMASYSRMVKEKIFGPTGLETFATI
jgi:hypothetical protein